MLFMKTAKVVSTAQQEEATLLCVYVVSNLNDNGPAYVLHSPIHPANNNILRAVCCRLL